MSGHDIVAHLNVRLWNREGKGHVERGLYREEGEEVVSILDAALEHPGLNVRKECS